jgi:hypothetical protein
VPTFEVSSIAALADLLLANHRLGNQAGGNQAAS